LNYITIKDYKIKHKKKKLTKAQICYLNKFCTKDKFGNLKIPINLGKLDLRIRSKSQSSQILSILKAIDANKHISNLILNIEKTKFDSIINSLEESILIKNSNSKEPYIIENYILTPIGLEFLKRVKSEKAFKMASFISKFISI
jgi:predicted transcriptional regulator